MTKSQVQSLAVALLSVGVVVIDQALKIAVKTHMYFSESIRITDWFYIFFTENDGMAFGMEVVPKYFLTSFRIILVPVIIYAIYVMIRRGASWGLLVCSGLILGGAVGNIIDCVFYGLIFSSPSAPFVAYFVPFGHGYSSAFLGKVVDMLYFPLVEWTWPAWMPMLAGKHAIFFSPIFNFADASISVGIIAILLFYRNKIFR